MNNKTFTTLEFDKVKEALITRTASSLGKSHIEEMTPHTKEKVIRRLQEETAEGIKIIKASGHAPLHGIKDIRGQFKKIKAGASLDPEELNYFCDFLRSTRTLKKFMEKHEYQAPLLFGYSSYLEPLKMIEDEITFAIEGNRIADRASSQLKNIRRKSKIIEERIVARLNKFMGSADNKKFMQDQFYTIKSGLFCLPIKSACRSKVNGRVVELSSTGSTAYMTLNNVEALTQELGQLVLEEENECFQILSTLTGLILLEEGHVEENINIMGQMDFIFAKSKYSMDIDGSRPKLSRNNQFYLKDLRHPLLGKGCVPIDYTPLEETKTLVITGPNTGGKTVSLKMIGLAVLMHQSGLQIPVSLGSELPVFTKVMTDIGDGQSMQNSLSTFSGHMSGIADMLNHANKKSLVIIDEIGTGTDPLDGASLGISILEALYERGAYTLVSTHYGEIKDYSEKRRHFENAAMDFDRETLAPKYKLCMGVSGESNAYWIVKELGISDKIINRAKKIAKNGIEGLITEKDMTAQEYYIARQSYLKERQAQMRQAIESGEKEEEKEQISTISFGQGDRVKSASLGVEALVYETDEFTAKVTVFYNNQMISLGAEDLTLVFSAESLYPVGYNMDQLFRTFKDRKLEKDIDKGRFKNLKELKSRMLLNDKQSGKKY